MRLKATAGVLACFFTILAGARQADAALVLTTDASLLAGAPLIDFEDLVIPLGEGPLAIADQYAALGVTFSSGLHTDTTIPSFVSGSLFGTIAASNGDPGCCPAIAFTFSRTAKRLGFDIISLDEAVTSLTVYAVVEGTSTLVGTFVLDTALEAKFFGVIADESDPHASFDSVVILTELERDKPSGFVLDNVRFVAAVPEPATVTFVGLGALALVGRVRRSRRDSPIGRSR